MYKIEFTLKQHTPIIHFQPDQEGATLRASEVKPKLDGFLIKKLGGIKSIRSQQPSWVNIKHPSLNYKLHIFNLDSTPLKINDVKTISDPDKTAVLTNKIQMIVISNYIDLLKTINNSIDEFFIINNFGNRQNKGWGGFTTQNVINQKEFEEMLLSNNRVVFKMSNPVNNFNQSTYDLITKKWRLLKSGHNYPYKKSLLFEYMCSNNKARWEKRAIKKAIVNDPVNFPEGLLNSKGYAPIDCKLSKSDHDYFSWEDNDELMYPYRFIRVFLGLPEHFEFRTNNSNILYQVLIKSNEDIERCKAPVTFKWFDKHVYAIIEEIPAEIFSKNFYFYVQKKKKINGKWTPEGSPIQIITDGLKTPKSFNIANFAKESFNEIGFKKLNFHSNE